MAELPTMPLYTDALLSDCDHMNDEVFGKYMRLLIRWWRRGAKPLSEADLIKYSRANGSDLDIIKGELTETPDGWIKKKLVNTFAKQSRRAETARENGKSGGRPKASPETKKEPKQNPTGSLSDTETEVDGKLSIIHDPSLVSKETKGKARERATRLSPDWTLPEKDREWARKHGLSDKEIDREAETMRDWSISEKTGKGVKRDWSAAWRNWVRRNKNFSDGIKVEARTAGVTLPEDPDAKARAEQLLKRIGKAAYASYFNANPPLKNGAGWVVETASEGVASKIDHQYGVAMDDVYGRKNWRVEVKKAA